jgi:hypothetical protein
MAAEPNNDPRLLEALEACRSGSDDLADPAMESLRQAMSEAPQLRSAYERLQRLDHALADAFCDVPVPDGLESRILARLKAAIPELGAVTPASTADPAIVCGNRTGARAGRRRWFFSTAAVVAATVLLAVLLPHLNGREKITKLDALNGAIEHFMANPPDGGQSLRNGGELLSEFPVSPSLAALLSLDRSPSSGIRWRVVPGFLNRKAMAYDFVGARGISATLYVTACSVDGLTAEVPHRQMLSTGQSSASAWQEGGLLYVLVVDGGDRAYEQLFAATAGPVT